MVMGRVKIPHILLLACSLILVCAVVYLAANRSLSSTLEGETAEVAREFLEGNGLLINHLNGQEDLDKPALYYWIIALLSSVAPSWELAARIPSIASLFLLAFAIYRLRDPSDSYMLFPLTCFVIISSPKVLLMAQTGRMDMLFTAACFGSIVAFYLFWKNGQDRGEYLGCPTGFFVLAACAVMLKGPVGAILTFCPVAIFLCAEGKWHVLKRVFLGKGIILFFALTVPWYAAASIATDFRFFHRFILEENLSRFTSLIPGGPYKDFSHHPINRYFVYFLTGFFPWSLVWPFWVYDILRNWKQRDKRSRLLFIYFWFVFIFFTLAISKRSDYILPLYPAGALLTVLFMLDGQKKWRVETPYLALFAVLFAAGSALSIVSIIALNEGPDRLAHFFRATKKMEMYFYLLSKYNFLLIGLIALAIIGLFGLLSRWILARRWERDRLLGLFSVLMTTSLALFVTVFLTSVYKEKDARQFCKEIAHVVKDSPLYYYGFWDEECTFYLHRRINSIYSIKLLQEKINGDEKIFLILKGQELKNLEQKGISFPFICREKAPPFRPLVLVSNAPVEGDNCPQPPKTILYKAPREALVAKLFSY